MQQEVDKGTLSDRRIFEFAAKQSNRESIAQSEIEIRDKQVQRLTEALLGRDGDLASAEYTVHHVEGQVEELCRVRRREDVNLDYLKSIIVQYLSKPPGSSERAALLPVLATLLQVRITSCGQGISFPSLFSLRRYVVRRSLTKMITRRLRRERTK